MNKINKTLLTLALGTSLFSLNAQDKNKNPFAERAELVQKYANNQAFNICWYVGAVDSTDYEQQLNRFLSFSNYLSNKLGTLVILNPFKTDKESAIEALGDKYDIVYTSTLMVDKLINEGWNPILARNDNIQLVVLALDSNTKINSEKDFKNTLIVTSIGSSISKAVGYGLINENLVENAPLLINKNYLLIDLSRDELLNTLKQKKADGLILRENKAEQLLKENPGIYKIVYKSKPVSGHILLSSPKIDKNKLSLFMEAIKSLDDLPKKSPILNAMDGGADSKTNIVFKQPDMDELKYGIKLSKLNSEFKVVPKQ